MQGTLPLLSCGASIVPAGSNIAVKGSTAFSVYAATKAAVRSLVRSWVAELVERGVRVNAAAPGQIGTTGLSGHAAPEETEAMLEGLASGVPMRRLGIVDEIADTVLFLASPRAAYITGTELYVDGGASQI